MRALVAGVRRTFRRVFWLANRRAQQIPVNLVAGPTAQSDTRTVESPHPSGKIPDAPSEDDRPPYFSNGERCEHRPPRELPWTQKRSRWKAHLCVRNSYIWFGDGTFATAGIDPKPSLDAQPSKVSRTAESGPSRIPRAVQRRTPTGIIAKPLCGVSQLPEKTGLVQSLGE